MSTKRQQTMAKMARDRAVRERRARKLEKKHAAAAERKAAAEGTPGVAGSLNGGPAAEGVGWSQPVPQTESGLSPQSTDAP